MSTAFIQRDDLSLIRFACGEHRTHSTHKACFEIRTTTQYEPRGVAHLTFDQLIEVFNVLRDNDVNLESYQL